MKIVVLDGYTLNPGDISWGELENLGDVKVYDRTQLDQLMERAQGSHALLTNKTQLTKEILDKLPELRYIGVLATGYDIVDVTAACNNGVTVTNIPSYGTDSVAQFVFALLLELCHHAGFHHQSVRLGEWSDAEDWCYWRTPLVELSGKTMGIIGFGRIGRKTAQIASAMGMNVLFVDSNSSDESGGSSTIKRADLDELLETSDVISLHCPLTPQNEGMINKSSLAKMKSSAFLINTSRGKLVKDEELAEALNHGLIAGAGLDVLSVEPPSKDNPLLSAQNCIITPHIAWASKESRSRLLDVAVGNYKAFLEGKPCNEVSKP